MTDPANILNFLLYLGTAVLLLAAFLAGYTLITPIEEWQQIRAGNTAVAVSLGGAMIGFTLPLSSSIVHNNTLAATVVTAAIALVVQLLCYVILRALRRGSDAAVERGELAEAILRAATSITLGMLNAACLT